MGEIPTSWSGMLDYAQKENWKLNIEVRKLKEENEKLKEKQVPKELEPIITITENEYYLPPVTEIVGWQCPVCGKEVPNENKYCGNCGQAVCDD